MFLLYRREMPSPIFVALINRRRIIRNARWASRKATVTPTFAEIARLELSFVSNLDGQRTFWRVWRQQQTTLYNIFSGRQSRSSHAPLPTECRKPSHCSTETLRHVPGYTAHPQKAQSLVCWCIKACTDQSVQSGHLCVYLSEEVNTQKG